MFKIMQVKKTAGSVEQRSLAFKDLTCVAKRSNHLLCSCASFPLHFYCSYFCSRPPFCAVSLQTLGVTAENRGISVTRRHTRAQTLHT